MVLPLMLLVLMLELHRDLPRSVVGILGKHPELRLLLFLGGLDGAPYLQRHRGSDSLQLLRQGPGFILPRTDHRLQGVTCPGALLRQAAALLLHLHREVQALIVNLAAELPLLLLQLAAESRRQLLHGIVRLRHHQRELLALALNQTRELADVLLEPAFELRYVVLHLDREVCDIDGHRLPQRHGLREPRLALRGHLVRKLPLSLEGALLRPGELVCECPGTLQVPLLRQIQAHLRELHGAS
mmetsp:Transcript_85172/g.216969  ORF Transcript_85172/g.216969 Transcript_85172/m.216969 type:complete len:242 (-) Transcript_85172:331-1056(-)